MALTSRDIEEFIKDLSQWYIRRSRSRFGSGDFDAIGTLHYLLINLTKLLAPFIPFVSEEIYQNISVNLNLSNSKESVHLEDYPEFSEKEIDSKLITKMESIRGICSNGLKARESLGLSLRQPLSKGYISVDDEYVMDVVREELNLKEVIYSKKPVEGNGIVTVGEYESGISLDGNLTDELKNEGMVNDFLRKYRDLRKKKGLRMDDMVKVKFLFEEGDTKKLLEDYVLENKKLLQASRVEVSKEEKLFKDEFTIAGSKIMVLFE